MRITHAAALIWSGHNSERIVGEREAGQSRPTPLPAQVPVGATRPVLIYSIALTRQLRHCTDSQDLCLESY